MGGLTGALLTGVFAQKSVNAAGLDGLLYGNPAQFLVQVIAVLVAVVFSGVATYVLLKLVGLVLPLRATEKEEGMGMDISQHGEEAYSSGEGAILVMDNELPAVSAVAVELKPAVSA